MILDYILIPLTLATVILTFIVGYTIGRSIMAKDILDYVDRIADCVRVGGNLRYAMRTRPDDK